MDAPHQQETGAAKYRGSVGFAGGHPWRIMRTEANNRGNEPMRAFWTAACVCFAATAALAESKHQSHSPYAGEEQRAIKTLSHADVEDLRQGKGWGLAKAAELNGLPGPVHLLEMKSAIALSSEQVQALAKLYEGMKAQAIPLGRELIAREQDLNRAFATKSVTAESLRDALDRIGQTRSQLRYVHLAAHLSTVDILTKDQVALYNRLRGYQISH